MNINLTPFLILGALLILSVIAMIAWRKVVASGEEDSVHVLDAGSGQRQTALSQKLDVIDKWGKLLTIVAVIYSVVVGALYVYQQFTKASNLGI